MARYMTIYRYTPEQAHLIYKRLMSLADQSAPKPVLEAFAKAKSITAEYATSSNFFVWIYEIEDKDLPGLSLVAMYIGDACTMETHPVLSAEEQMKTSMMFGKILAELESK